MAVLLAIAPINRVSAIINVTLADTLRNDTLFVFCYGTASAAGENLGNCNFVLDMDPAIFDVTNPANFGFVYNPTLYPAWYFSGINFADTSISATLSNDLNITTVRSVSGSAVNLPVGTPTLLFAIYLVVEDGNCNNTPTIAWNGPIPFTTRLRNYAGTILNTPAQYTLNNLNVTTLCPVQSIAAERTTDGPAGGIVCLYQTVTFTLQYDANPFNSPMGSYNDTLGVTSPVTYQLIHPTSGPIGSPGFASTFTADTFTVAGNYTIRTTHVRNGCTCIEDALVFSLSFFSQPDVTVPTNLITRCGSGVESFSATHVSGTGTPTFTFHWYNHPTVPPSPFGLGIGAPTVSDIGFADGSTSTQNFLVSGSPGSPDTIFIRIQDNNSCIADDTVEIQFSDPVRVDVTVFLEGPYSGPGAMSTGISALLTDLFTTSGSALGDTTSNIPAIAGFAANANLGFAYNTTSGTGVYIPNGLTMDPGQSVPSNAVDIIRIDLFATAGGFAPSTSIDSTFAWLLDDGSIRNFSTGLNNFAEFCGDAVDGNDYHVMVSHRNHNPVISNAAFTLFEASATSVDLSVTANIYDPSGFGAAAKDISGVAVMAAGNVFDDPGAGDVFQVNAMDYFVGFYANAGPANGYSRADVNLDGSTNAADYNIISSNNDALWTSMVPY
jgi:hypothetical protein